MRLLPKVGLVRDISLAELSKRFFPRMRNCRIATCSIAALFAVGSCPAVAAADVINPGFYELGASSVEGQNYEKGRMLALQLLGSASGLDDEMASLAAKASEHLAAAKFYVSADAEGDRQCAKIVASLFVSANFPNVIFICADTRWHVQQGSGPTTNILAQGFVHEAVHLAGTTDECAATLLELKVAGDGLGAIGYGNFRRYSKLCDGLLDGYAPKRR